MTISANNKQRQEHLQEIRNPTKYKIQYRRRKQETIEEEKYLKDEIERLKEEQNAPIRKVY